jgi:hypothetical protein
MHILPRNRKEWLEILLFPFKAYIFIAPLMVAITVECFTPYNVRTPEQVFVILGLLPCSAVLLVAALVLALVGPKGTALPCLGFALAALIVWFILLIYCALQRSG